jgi:hypothetical protein
MTQPSSGASAIRFNEIPGYSGIATPSSDDLLVALNVAAERNYVITLADIGPLAGVPTGFPQGAVAFGGEDGSLAHDGDSLLYDGDEGILQVGGIRSFPASVSNGDGDDLLFSAGMGDGDGDGGDIVFRSSVPGASGSGPHSPLALARLGLGGFSLDIPLPSSPGVTVRAAASQSASLLRTLLADGVSVRASIDSAGSFTNSQGQTNSEAFGAGASVASTASVAIGQGASVSAIGGIAIGQGAASAFAASIVFGQGASATADNQVILGSAASPITQVWLGKGAAAVASAVSAVQIACTPLSGIADSVGANLTFVAGLSTGAEPGGDVVFRTSYFGSSGSTQNTVEDRLRLQTVAASSLREAVFGPNASATPFTQILRGSAGSGTDVAGAGLVIAAGPGTGAALGGIVSIRTSLAGASGATQRSLTEGWKLDPSLGVVSTAMSATLPALRVVGASGQSVNIFRAELSDGTLRARITSTGDFSNSHGFTNSEAFGNESVVSATNATAIGRFASAAGSQSVAVGTGAQSVGASSVAVGQEAEARGDDSVAIGRNTNSDAAAARSVQIGSGSTVVHADSVAIGYLATSTASNQFVVGSGGSPLTYFWLGEGVEDATPPASVLIGATGASAANTAGSSLFVHAGISRGSGVGGDLVLQTSPAGGAGSLQNALVDRLRIKSTGVIWIGDGAVGAPVLSFSADTDTGIWRPGDNQFGISAGGVNRLLLIGATNEVAFGPDVSTTPTTVIMRGSNGSGTNIRGAAIEVGARSTGNQRSPVFRVMGHLAGSSSAILGTLSATPVAEFDVTSNLTLNEFVNTAVLFKINFTGSSSSRVTNVAEISNGTYLPFIINERGGIAIIADDASSSKTPLKVTHVASGFSTGANAATARFIGSSASGDNAIRFESSSGRSTRFYFIGAEDETSARTLQLRFAAAGSAIYTFSSTSLTLGDGVNIILNTTTGSQLGTSDTQKLGLFGRTPVSRPASADQAALTDSTTGDTSAVVIAAVSGTGADATINNNFARVIKLLNAIRTAGVSLGTWKGAA